MQNSERRNFAIIIEKFYEAYKAVVITNIYINPRLINLCQLLLRAVKRQMCIKCASEVSLLIISLSFTLSLALSLALQLEMSDTERNLKPS